MHIRNEPLEYSIIGRAIQKAFGTEYQSFMIFCVSSKDFKGQCLFENR